MALFKSYAKWLNGFPHHTIHFTTKSCRQAPPPHNMAIKDNKTNDLSHSPLQNLPDVPYEHPYHRIIAIKPAVITSRY